MKYEMQVYVSVSAENPYEAGRIIKRQLEKRDYNQRKSEVEYIDSESLKAEPECDSCQRTGKVTEDWTTCAACQSEMDYDDAQADARLAGLESPR